MKTKGFRLTRRAFAYPYMLFMLIFIVLPLVLILVNAFIADGAFSLDNFGRFFSDGASIGVLSRSLLVGIVTTILCLALGYPVAYLLVKYNYGKVFVLLYILPMWVNFLLRTLATKSLFEALGVPLGDATVVFGMVYNYLPFMILPLYTVISSIDKSYMEAAADLGADKATVFFKTLVPLSIPGILSGITMVFIPTISTFAISQFLSNNTVHLFGDSIQTKFSQGLYGVGSVMSIVMLVLVLLSNLVMNRFSRDEQIGRNLW